MNDQSTKWLIAGFAGALCSILFIAAVVFLAVKYGPGIHVKNGQVFVCLHATCDHLPDIRKQWAKRQSNHQDEIRQIAAKAENLGLHDRYKTVQFHDDTREKLYQDRDYALVEGRLSAQLAACTTPLAYDRYSQHIEHLGAFTPADHPVQLMVVLDEWVSTRPDSYDARLIRGIFGREYHWLVNGYSLSEASEAEGWRDGDEMREQSRVDLTRAWELNDKDPQIPFWRMRVNATLRDGGDGVEMFYNDVIALYRFHLSARQSMVHYAKPDYGGSEEKIAALSAEAIEASEGFPLLLLIPIYVTTGRTENRSLSEEEWESTWRFPDRLAVYEAQIAVTPDDPYLMACAAHFAVRARQPDRAAHWFERLGNIYPEGSGSPFLNVVQYHEARVEVLGAEAQ